MSRKIFIVLLLLSIVVSVVNIWMYKHSLQDAEQQQRQMRAVNTWESNTSINSFHEKLIEEDIQSTNATSLSKQPFEIVTQSALNTSHSKTTLIQTTATARSAKRNVTKSFVRTKSGILLMWEYPWGVKSEGPREGTKYGDCVLTYKRELLKESDAVIFPYMNAPTTWPHYRHPRQRFVWLSMESPWTVRWVTKLDLKQYDNGFFNWTMTYKSDADVYFPYREMIGKVYLRLKKGKDVVDQILASKSEIAGWMASDCQKKGGKLRLQYVNEMMKTIPSIERYGKCFGNANQMPWSKVGEFLRKKKFYLSFENSLHCKDYITEKYYVLGMSYDLVPVVWGTKKEDYLRIAPPHSFIHAEDFSSPEELSKYLLHLDSNDTAYREYFRWREDPNKTWDDLRREVEGKYPNIKTLGLQETRWNHLCKKLFSNETTKVIPSLRKIIFDSESEECTNKT